MGWFGYALISALGQSASNVFNKKGLAKADSTFATWILMLFGAPLAITFASVSPVPTIGSEFYPSVIMGTFFYLGGAWTFTHALKLGDLSLVAPLALLAPISVTILSPFITGDPITLAGMLGVLVVISGAFFLSGGVKGLNGGFFRRPGVSFALVSAAFQTCNALADPLGIRASSPAFFTATKFCLMLVCITPFAVGQFKRNWTEARGHILMVIVAGLGLCLATICQSYALEFGNPGYVLTIKRLSTVFSVFIAAIFLRECSLRERLPATLVMFAGVVIIYLS